MSFFWLPCSTVVRVNVQVKKRGALVAVHPENIDLLTKKSKLLPHWGSSLSWRTD
jgi:hypothetical protein